MCHLLFNETLKPHTFSNPSFHQTQRQPTQKVTQFSHSNLSSPRREFGLERFVPTSLIDGMKRKELRRLVSHFLKLNSQMTGSSKVLTQLQAKIHYLDIISGLPSYGAKCFSTNQRDGIERVLLVSPRFGLSQIAGSKNSVVGGTKTN
jgi:hypothetical protein